MQRKFIDVIPALWADRIGGAPQDPAPENEKRAKESLHLQTVDRRQSMSRPQWSKWRLGLQLPYIDGTGQVLDAIEQAGISDNTVVVWSSDNPAGRSTSMGGSNGPWRGHFGSGFEGGMRAPAIVRWPGRVKAGSVSAEILSAVDWMPTLASLAGERPGAHRPPHRRSRCVGVPARAELDDRTRSCHLL